MELEIALEPELGTEPVNGLPEWQRLRLREADALGLPAGQVLGKRAILMPDTLAQSLHDVEERFVLETVRSIRVGSVKSDPSIFWNDAPWPACGSPCRVTHEPPAGLAGPRGRAVRATWRPLPDRHTSPRRADRRATAETGAGGDFARRFQTSRRLAPLITFAPRAARHPARDHALDNFGLATIHHHSRSHTRFHRPTHGGCEIRRGTPRLPHHPDIPRSHGLGVQASRRRMDAPPRHR